MSKNKAYIIWTLLLFGLGRTTVYAQSVNNVNELKIEELKAEKVLNSELFERINSANLSISSNPSKALSELEESLKLAYRTKNKRGEAFTFQSLGAVYFELKNYEKSIDFYEKAEKLLKKLNEENAYFLVKEQLATSYEGAGKYVQAEKAYKEFIALAAKKGYAEKVSLSNEKLARVYFNQKKFQEAKQLYRKLLLENENGGDSSKILDYYKYLGKSYAGLRDTAMSMKYLKKAALVADNSTADQQANNWNQVSRGYNSVGDYGSSVAYEKKAYRANKKRKGSEKILLSNSLNIGNDYLLMNNATEAIPYLQESVNLAEQLGEVEESGEAYKALSEAYAQQGKFEEAKRNFDQYRKSQERLLNQKEEKLLALNSANSNFQDKEKQIAILVESKELDEKRITLLEEEKRLKAANLSSQKRINYFLIAISVLLLLGVLLLVRSSKQKQMANKLMAIRSLQSQMNPHFIFNSLNSVNSFISENDERSANKYLSEFARLMRSVLDHSKKDFVSLEDELNVLKRYLSLEHLRFKDKFEYNLHVDKDLDVDNLLIPPMLVQPFIENAVWHGLRYQQSKGELNVRFGHNANHLVIEIIDNGIGIEASKKLKTKNQKQSKSTGIKSTTDRLHLLNEVHKVEIKAEINPLNENGTGTCVRLMMKKIAQTETEEIE